MAKLAAIILIWGFAGAAVFGEETQELQWHSSVTLQGTLEYNDFYGPPNYGETPEQDVVERIWMLALDQPIQVSGEVFDSLVKSTAADSTIQLLGLKQKWRSPGLCIVVEGEILPSHSGHHHKPILMDITFTQPCPTEGP